MGVGQFEAHRVNLPVQIVLPDLDAAEGHAQALVTEQFLSGQAHTGPQLFRGISVAKLVRWTGAEQPARCQTAENSLSRLRLALFPPTAYYKDSGSGCHNV